MLSVARRGGGSAAAALARGRGLPQQQPCVCSARGLARCVGPRSSSGRERDGDPESHKPATELKLATAAIHAGAFADPKTHASVPPLHLSTTFSVQEPLSFSANELQESDPWCYTRWANPTTREVTVRCAAPPVSQ